MKNVIILFSILVIQLANAYGQNPQLMGWYGEINKISLVLQRQEIISLKKEVLYDGCIIPVAPGMFTYMSGNGSTDTIPFLYSYGRISMEKNKFNRMLRIVSDSAKLTVRISFQPTRVSPYQKVNAEINDISFYTTKQRLVDLYINRNEVTLMKSFYAITTLKDCYKVVYVDHLTGGFYYYIPYENKKRKKIMNKLDKLFSKQYNERCNLLNYF